MQARKSISDPLLTLRQKRFLAAVRHGELCTGAIQQHVERCELTGEMTRQAFWKLKQNLLDRGLITTRIGTLNRLVVCSITDDGRLLLNSYERDDMSADSIPVGS